MGSFWGVFHRFVGAYREFVGAHKRFGGAAPSSVAAPKRSVRASRPAGRAARRFGRASEPAVCTIECLLGAIEPSVAIHEGFGSVAVSGSILPVPRIRNELKPAISAFCRRGMRYWMANATRKPQPSD